MSASPKPGNAQQGMNSFMLRKKTYSDPPKHCLEAARNAKKRLQQAKQTGVEPTEFTFEEEQARLERERQLDLIGELKAAEARNRLRVVRLRYEANRTQEINHLVASQPSALAAVRLKVILPTPTGTGQQERIRDSLGKLERQRVERLIELPIDTISRRA